MRSYERNQVVVDQCTGCGGLFLDRGELERLVEAESSFYSQTQPPPSQQAPPPQQGRRCDGRGRRAMAKPAHEARRKSRSAPSSKTSSSSSSAKRKARPGLRDGLFDEAGCCGMAT